MEAFTIKRGPSYTRISDSQKNFMMCEGVNFFKKEISLSYKKCKKTFKQLNIIFKFKHENIIKFMGVSFAVLNPIFLFEHASKGSLYDLIHNKEFEIDIIFQKSFVKDIINGLIYLHKSLIGFHGILKSTNCMISSTYTVKLAGFSPSSIVVKKLNIVKKNQRDSPEDEKWAKKLLWTAPEILKCEKLAKKKVRKFQMADMFSFGVIIVEILNKTHPFDYINRGLKATEIISSFVRNEEIQQIFAILIKNCDSYLQKEILKCFNVFPSKRPSAKKIKHKFQLYWGDIDSHCVVDHLLIQLERHTCNLKELVEERTRKLNLEMIRSDELLRKSEDLLYEMLPRSVAENLRNGETYNAKRFESVTIFFSDIVGFTEISSKIEPIDVLCLLNSLYSIMDEIGNNFDVYKMETVGDAYMVVSGLPEENDTHVKEIAGMSLEIIKAVSRIEIASLKDSVKIRIGIHSGPVCAGIVGKKRPKYCLFGDTVNTASRMESNSEEMKIHMSKSSKILIDKHPEFIVEPRGYIDVKGKGKMYTYWLMGRINS